MSPPAPEAVLERLSEAMPDLSPQLRKAARHVLDHPADVGVSSLRRIAEAADVKPNTMVRLLRTLGFEGYEAFQRPFVEAARSKVASFPDRAQWLRSLGQGGKHARLLGDMAQAHIANLEATFAGTSVEALKEVALLIGRARKTYVLGVGVMHPLAETFTYLASQAIESVFAIPGAGSLPVDDVARAGPEDVLIAMTVEPYRSDVVAAVLQARAQGTRLVAITDGRASPIAAGADHLFLVASETPQFFTSIVAVGALLESLMAFLVAQAPARVVSNIERFHERRRELGVYWTDEDWSRLARNGEGEA